MHMITIPIGLDEELVKKVDMLVIKGIYKNRTEALRDQIRKGIEKIQIIDLNPFEDDNYNAILKSLINLEEPPNLIQSRKSVLDLISECRER